MSTWTTEKCVEHPDRHEIRSGGLVLACVPTAKQARPLIDAHNSDVAPLDDLLTERDQARASALRAWDRAAELERLLVDGQATTAEEVSTLRGEIDLLRVERDEARNHNVIQQRRLNGDVGEQLDVLMKNWQYNEAHRVAPLTSEEAAALRAALNDAGVADNRQVSPTELLAALRALNEDVAVRYVMQLQQLADDGRAMWERGMWSLSDKLHAARERAGTAERRAEAAEAAVAPLRRRRDQLIDELARVKTQNGMAAVDELEQIAQAIAQFGPYPDTEVGQLVRNLDHEMRDQKRRGDVLAVQLLGEQAARLDATHVALATLSRITKPLRRRRATKETP